MSYQAIARRYRPQCFSDVVGQDAIVTTLKNAIRMDKVAHAYLFCGLRGTGKTTLARLFAKILNCQSKAADFEPCNQCPSCIEITSGKSLDVLEIDGASNRGIDDIREITGNVGYASTSGDYKIVIIDEVHMLTKEAFNALLKTLEEPPEKVIFIFATTEPHKVLPTILSRCQRFDLARISPQSIHGKLKKIALDLGLQAEDAALDLIVERSEGSLRDAESLLDQIGCCLEEKLTEAKVASILGIPSRELLKTLSQAIQNNDLSAAFTLADTLFKEGKDPLLFLDQIAQHFREALAIKLGKYEIISPYPVKAEILSQANLYTEQQCLYNLEYLLLMQNNAAKMPFKKLHLEMILLHLIRSLQKLSLASLTKRLIDLEDRLQGQSLQASPEIKTIVPEAPVLEVPIPKAPIPEVPVFVALEEAPIMPKPPEAKSQEAKSTKIIPPLSETVVSQMPVAEKADAKKPSYHYDTLLRFAAIELEGTVKK